MKNIFKYYCAKKSLIKVVGPVIQNKATKKS